MSVTLPVNVETLKIISGPKKTVQYPRIAGIPNQAWETKVNQAMVHATQQLINQQVGNMPSTVEEMLGWYEWKNNQRNVLSLSLYNYTYHHQAAHGMTLIKSLTFDMEKEKKCELKDLFKPNSDYVKRLSNLIRTQITLRKIDLLEPFKQIRPDQDFYIADKTLVIYFQLYEITPYVFGFPMFSISVYDIQDIIDEDGPLARMAENN